MSLEREIKKCSATVSTESYSMSVGELVSMYRDSELDLHPEFQRFFRWTTEQKSRFIESLLLGIPIPPIFVSERDDSKWEVIDGLQRLSTILQIMGELRNEKGEREPPLELTGTRYLPSLKGKKWTNNDKAQEIPESARITVKRSRLDVNIIRKTSDYITKYEIFQRLNSGGTQATHQEIRNCILAMENIRFFEWIRSLGDDENFRNSIVLTDRAMEESFDLELVTRYIVLLIFDENQLGRIGELNAFLTEELLERAKDSDFPRQDVENAFRCTFAFLADSLDQNSFRRYDEKKERYTGSMLISLFEIIAVGIGYRILNKKGLPDREKFKSMHRLLWDKNKLSGFTGSGVGVATRIPKTIAFGRSWLEECM